MRLRKVGLSYAEIAVKLGFKTPSGAKRAIDRAMAKTLQEPADDLRRMELERLDDAMRRIYPQVLQGSLQAVDRLLKIMDHRAKLMGLYAPTKTAATDPEGNPVESPATLLPRELVMRMAAAVMKGEALGA